MFVNRKKLRNLSSGTIKHTSLARRGRQGEDEDMFDGHMKKTGRRGSVPALAAALAMSFVLLALPAQTGATPGSSHVAFGAGGTANFGVNPSFPDCSPLFPPPRLRIWPTRRIVPFDRCL